MWFYKIMCVIMLATDTVHGTEYTISNETTDWNHASCEMAVPDLTYTQQDGWQIDKQHLSQLNISSDGVWIGYINASVAFEYLGCLQVSNPVETQLLNNIGDCNLKCKGNIFGVKKDSPSIQGVICTCIGSSDDMTAQSCTEVCDQNFICGKHNKDNFYKKTKVSYTSEDDPSSNCLIFRSLALPFKWQTCRDGGNPRLLCSIKNSDGQWVAYSMSTFWSSWVEANEGCLSNKTLPATLNSILKGKLSNDMNQPHWTGVIRTHTVLMADDRDFITRPGERTYSFVTNSGKIYFEGSGKRSSLCTASPAATTTPTYNLSTTIIPTEEIINFTVVFQEENQVASISPSNPIHSSTTSHQSTLIQSSTSKENIQKSTESTAMGIEIGISVAVFCIVGATIAILVLKNRGILPCKLGADKEQPADGTIAFEENMTYNKGLDDTVNDHNYFILEKGLQAVNENIDNYNTPCEANQGNGEEGTYNSIEDTDEPYRHFKDSNGDYDYTTNNLTSGSNTRKPENVYNKLKINRPGDYDHVDGRENNVTQAGNDYDTTSAAFASSNADVSDYNHIPHPV
ncbi:uncharacterized protein LOC127861221 isoform X9 [Dreissena polymorpha]|uniref:uncharacterized protein LOC127861221 isoform X9 n=1 Tax=Dreissena polymorpha TaxID=45954 RepID=UPI0022645431|nr:uncharacterized protein LOC127861221 isoform X9 [Dreissena polymorpha]